MSRNLTLPPKPRGELVIKTIAMPADINPNGTMFGGWLMAQMDLGGGIMAKQLAQGRVSTIAVESITFFTPVHVADTVEIFAFCEKSGTSSLQIKLEIWTTPPIATPNTSIKLTTQGTFHYVAIDEDNNKRPLPIEFQHYKLMSHVE